MGKFQEIVADVAVSGVIGAGAGFLMDRLGSGTKQRMALGITAAGSGAVGLGMKLWSLMDRRSNYPTWKDDIGDPMLSSASVLGGLVAMRSIDQQLKIGPTATPCSDAGLLAEAQYQLAVQAGDLPAGLTEINGGVPLTQAQMETALTDNPHLAFVPSTGLWDDSSTTNDWTTGG